jgi:hypothetical protein
VETGAVLPTRPKFKMAMFLFMFVNVRLLPGVLKMGIRTLKFMADISVDVNTSF